MGFFEPQTKDVDLGGGNRVTIRKLSYGENLETLSRAMTANGHLDAFQHARFRMQASVTDWQGPGFEGRKCSKENIDALPQVIAAKINDAISDLNKEVSDDEGNESGGATS
jgi:hypothetical protein